MELNAANIFLAPFHHCPAGNRHVALAGHPVSFCAPSTGMLRGIENADYSSDFRSQDTGAGQPARDY